MKFGHPHIKEDKSGADFSFWIFCTGGFVVEAVFLDTLQQHAGQVLHTQLDYSDILHLDLLGSNSWSHEALNADPSTVVSHIYRHWRHYCQWIHPQLC